MAKDGMISKEEITSAKRSEQRYRNLQPIRKDFYESTAEYLHSVRVKRSAARADLTKDLEYSNYNLIVNTYQGYAVATIQERLRKIADMAVMSVSGSNISIDLLTSEEREYFEAVKEVTTHVVDEFKRKAGDEVNAATSPDIESFFSRRKDEPATQKAPETVVPVQSVPVTSTTGSDVFDSIEEAMEFPDNPDLNDTEEQTEVPDDFPEEFLDPYRKTGDGRPAEEKSSNDKILIRVLEDVPEFEADRVYRLHKDEMSNLPKGVAQNLINLGLAVPVDHSS